VSAMRTGSSEHWTGTCSSTLAMSHRAVERGEIDEIENAF
jgi:hypothetical protein